MTTKKTKQKKIRKYKIYRRRIRKYHGRREYDHIKALKAQKPVYNFDHMVKERYPTFVEAVRDLDDALTMVFLFASLPQGKFVKDHVTTLCQRLSFEWMSYVMRARCLKKSFLSIKGIYYQAQVLGEQCTWIMPYPYTPNVPKDVDFRIMLSFLEFHCKHLEFVLYRLYFDLGLTYPPPHDQHQQWNGATLSAVTLAPLSEAQQREREDREQQERLLEDEEVKRVEEVDAEEVARMEAEVARVQEELRAMGVDALAFDEDDDDDADEAGRRGAAGDAQGGERLLDNQAEAELRATGAEFQQLALQTGDLNPEVSLAALEDPVPVLFRGLVFFLQRENLRDPLHFVLESCGATVGWEGESSPFGVEDDRITHVVCDRPVALNKRPDREYVQPQWVFDSLNFAFLLAPHEYVPGVALPPHLSPFVNDEAEGYVPERKTQILAYIEQTKGVQVQQLAVSGRALSAAAEEELEAREAEDVYQEGLALELGLLQKSRDNQEEQGAQERAKQRRREREQTEAAEAQEEKNLAAGTLTRKKRKLYQKIQYGKGKKSEKVKNLETKRDMASASKK